MHIQYGIQMIVKFMLLRPDFLNQFLHRLNIELIHLQFLFLLPNDIIAHLPVNCPPDDDRKKENKYNDHLEIQGSAYLQIYHQIHCDCKRKKTEEPVKEFFH